MLTIGSTGPAVKSLQNKLYDYGYYRGVVDGDFGPKTKASVEEFQRLTGLTVDGKAGPKTLSALGLAVPMENPGYATPPHRIVKANDEWFNGDLDGFRLRDDTAMRYELVHQAVRSAGGILTSSGGLRDLRAPVSAGRSATSFHYTGRALDLYLYSGMQNPLQDPFVIVKEAGFWRLYARVPAGPTIDLFACQWKAGRVYQDHVVGSFIDLTKLFEAHGFARITPRSAFPGSYISSEWWHFQDVTGMERGVTTFRDELLQIYTKQQLEGTPPWAFRDCVFGVNWK